MSFDEFWSVDRENRESKSLKEMGRSSVCLQGFSSKNSPNICLTYV